MNRTLLLTISVFCVFSLIGGQSVLLQTPQHDLLKSREALSQRSEASLYDVLVRRFRRSSTELLYDFSDHGGSDGYGDYQRDILSGRPQIQKNFNFTLPFFGLQFNYIRLSMDGYLEFTDPPEYYTYPLVFPNKNWPMQNDPSFIGIFYSKCRFGRDRPDDLDQRQPGVYFKLESDLNTRSDQPGAQLRARLMADISAAVEGSDDFIPKYAMIATWKNMSFAGGIDASLRTTNTFQLVLATDEVRTFVIFNYADLQWLSHTEAGGDTVTGMGGVSAFVGFNKGNGTQSYEYLPYSQSAKLRDIASQGCSLPGRHVFRIDQEIVLGTCKNNTPQV